MNNNIFKNIQVRRGVLFIFPNQGARLRKNLNHLPYLAFTGIALHPTVAANFGPSASKFLAVAVAVLFLPFFTRIIIAPAIAAGAAGLMLCAYFQSFEFFISAILAYFIFNLIYYDNARFKKICTSIIFITLATSTLQVFTTLDWLTAHVPQNSTAGDLNQFRPPAIFPASIFVSQIQLFSISLIFLNIKRSGLLFLLNGALAALSGATAGFFVVIFSLLLNLRMGMLAIFSFILTVFLLSLLKPANLFYNYSLEAISRSFVIRAPHLFEGGEALMRELGADQNLRQAYNSMELQYPSLLAVLEMTSLGGILLLCCLILLKKIYLGKILSLLAATGAIFLSQVLHPIFGSVFFSLFFGALLALAWWAVKPSIAPNR